LAQLSGRPLRTGDQLPVSGKLPSDARLLVRAADRSHIVEAEFVARRLAGQRTVISITGANDNRGRAAKRTGPGLEAVSDQATVRPTRTRVRRITR